MNEKKRIFIIGGLLVLLLVVWILVLRPAPKKNIKSIVAPEESGLEFKVLIEMAQEYSNNKDLVTELSYAEDRDPFSLQGKIISGGKIITSKLFEGLTLNGILWDPHKPLAVINGGVVGEGKIVKGVTVKKIELNRVILEAGGEEKVLFIEGVRRDINNKMEGLK